MWNLKIGWIRPESCINVVMGNCEDEVWEGIVSHCVLASWREED